jgi:hypothetical protein
MSLKTLWAAAVLAFVTSTPPAVALAPLDFEILDRKTGQALPVYWHEGERYVAGEPGREYEIRLRNRSGARVLAVTSVDGVNVITGRTASPQQSGYVLDPWGLVEIDGWRKSLNEVAAFYFTRLPDSYAARTGRPDNVGVIGVALFRERERPMPLEDYLAHPEASADAAAPSAQARSSTRESQRADAEESRLGTGHGRRLDSGAVYTHFERANEEPDEVIRIFYDSRKNLVAQGIIPPPWRFAQRTPDPFPEGFVPDP